MNGRLGASRMRGMFPGFDGGGGHASDGNRLARCVEHFDGVPLCAVRGHVMVHEFHDVATTETMPRARSRRVHVIRGIDRPRWLSVRWIEERHADECADV